MYYNCRYWGLSQKRCQSFSSMIARSLQVSVEQDGDSDWPSHPLGCETWLCFTWPWTKFQASQFMYLRGNHEIDSSNIGFLKSEKTIKAFIFQSEFSNGIVWLYFWMHLWRISINIKAGKKKNKKYNLNKKPYCELKTIWLKMCHSSSQCYK